MLISARQLKKILFWRKSFNCLTQNNNIYKWNNYKYSCNNLMNNFLKKIMHTCYSVQKTECVTSKDMMFIFNKICIYLRCMSQWCDLHIHSKMLTIIKLIMYPFLTQLPFLWVVRALKIYSLSKFPVFHMIVSMYSLYWYSHHAIRSLSHSL